IHVLGLCDQALSGKVQGWRGRALSGKAKVTSGVCVPTMVHLQQVVLRAVCPAQGGPQKSSFVDDIRHQSAFFVLRSDRSFLSTCTPLAPRAVFERVFLPQKAL
ncbi:MAG: hypothetical protein ACK56I_03645, partial [bacterium]